MQRRGLVTWRNLFQLRPRSFKLLGGNLKKLDQVMKLRTSRGRMSAVPLLGDQVQRLHSLLDQIASSHKQPCADRSMLRNREKLALCSVNLAVRKLCELHRIKRNSWVLLSGSQLQFNRLTAPQDGVHLQQYAGASNFSTRLGAQCRFLAIAMTLPTGDCDGSKDCRNRTPSLHPARALAAAKAQARHKHAGVHDLVGHSDVPRSTIERILPGGPMARTRPAPRTCWTTPLTPPVSWLRAMGKVGG